MIYFDNAATTPVIPAVADRIREVLVNDWGNPSSLHRKGFEAEKIIEKAREEISRAMLVKPKTLIFTSCATEANNMAVRSAIKGKTGANIVYSAVEHASIDTLAKQLAKEGVETRIIPVDEKGRVNADDLAKLVDENTALVCVMQVNNELGTIQPVEELARVTKQINPKAKFLVDGVQGFCKFPLNLKDSPIDYYSVSAHKIHGPKGIGLLYVKEGEKLEPLMYGGGHEFGLRPGTENVAYIAGFEEAVKHVDEFSVDEVKAIRDRCLDRLTQIPDHIINSPEVGSPYILNFALKDVKAEVLLHFMEQEEMYLSSGSACTGAKVSHVLEAIKLPKEYIEGCVRISFLTENKVEEVDPFFDQLEKAVEQIRSLRR